MTDTPSNPASQQDPVAGVALEAGAGTGVGGGLMPHGRSISRRRRGLISGAFAAVCILTAAASVAVLGVLLLSIARQGWATLFAGWAWPFVRTSFFTNPPSRIASEAGIMPGLWGTVLLCSVCAVSAIPLGVATAIFLEEFRPRRKLARAIHGFVELNIRNLAGVPSIVYGLLGLTIFVNAFGLFGSAMSPAWRIGVSHYDEFYLVDESLALVKVAGPDAPTTELVDGLRARFEGTGKTVALRVMEQDEVDALVAAGRPLPAGAIVAGQEPYRLEDRAWWYMQLPFGRSALAGGLTMMLVVLPMVIIASCEALRSVPNSLRYGALAAGATRWQMVWKMTLPAAIPGIMTGSILAMSRAIGETAPVIVVGAVVSIRHSPENLLDTFSALPMQIYDWTSRPNPEFRAIAASAIIVLLGVLLIFNLVAVLIRQRFSKPLH
jgi:phosphate transport system permease protein